jgi:hypothetical protein
MVARFLTPVVADKFLDANPLCDDAIDAIPFLADKLLLGL